MAESKLELCTETEHLRAKIRHRLSDIDAELEALGGSELERYTKALTALFKLTQAIDEHAAKLAVQALAQNELKYTPYDKIPPPTETEMREIRARLKRHYDRLRAAYNPDGTAQETGGA